MVKGGALYYAIITLLLSSMIIGSILLSAYYHDITLQNKIADDKAHNLVLSAIKLAASSNSSLQVNQEIEDYKVFPDDTSTVSLEIKQWGAMKVICSSTNSMNRSISRCALVASNPFDKERTCLYLADKGRGLSISGSTRLSGTCYLPDKRIKTASIEGQPYNGKSLVSGHIKESNKDLPSLNANLFDGVNNVSERIDENRFSQVLYQNQIPEYLKVSFYDEPVIIYSLGSILLSECDLDGNVVVFSEDVIYVDSTCKTKNIILVAPAVEILDGFAGSLQVFSDYYISIGKGCTLELPSFLGISNSLSGYSGKKTITIAERTNIHGVIAFKDQTDLNSIDISENSTVYGQIYCPGQVTLKGNVIGSLYCHSFYLRTQRAQYLNHLLNSKITPTELSAYYVGPSLFESEGEKAIARWLD